MIQPLLAEGREQVLDTMIDLTRLSNMQRTIAAGSDSMELCHSLRRRGFVRVYTPTARRTPRAQHAIGLVAGRDIENALAEISPFLTAHATVAVLIDSRDIGFSLRVRMRLQQMGFQIEAGVRCPQGLVMSAYRQVFNQMESAA